MTASRMALIDTEAISQNVRVIRALTAVDSVVCVVKANGYGHDANLAARAAVSGGADIIATADLDEAVALRHGGITAPILCWLHSPDTDFTSAVSSEIHLGISTLEQLDMAIAACATVHIKLETGLARNGLAPQEWDEAFRHAAAYERSGLTVAGIMTHLSNTSVKEDQKSLALFDQGVAAAERAGLNPRYIHAAATAAALTLPESRYNTVRIGLGMYGLSPFDGITSAQLGLTPAMTLTSSVVAVRRVQAGHSVSYGYKYTAAHATTLALVPLGYADGIPRQASGRSVVSVKGKIVEQVGTIAMDQFVIDVGDQDIAVGDRVIVFGDPETGVPSAEQWATAAGTINYDIVTRIGQRVRRFVSDEQLGRQTS